MKDKKIIVWVLLLVAFLGIMFSVCYFVLNDKDDKKTEEKYSEDEKKFEQEYEEINGKVRESTGVINSTIDVPTDNNIVYATDNEIASLLEDGTALIYMGFRECPWCRNAVPVLIDTAKESGVDKIYYLDVTDIKSTIILDAKNKVKITKKGTDGYYKIMELLDDYLNDYYLTDSKGKKIATGEKRIYSPTVVAVREGVVVGYHTGTVSGHVKDSDGVLPSMNEEQMMELVSTYELMIAKMNGSICDESCE